jgi:hypothetical protein
MFIQYGFDLAQFDPESTDLYLLVHPPQIFDLAGCLNPGKVPRAMTVIGIGHGGSHPAQRAFR